MNRRRSERRDTSYITRDEETRQYLKMSVSYNKGGMSFATYKNKPRGFYLNFTSIKIEGSFEVSEPMAKGNGYLLLEEVGRYNERRLRELGDILEANKQDIYNHYLNGDIPAITALLTQKQNA